MIAKQKRMMSIAAVVGFCLLIGLLRFVPISTSFGERDDHNSNPHNTCLQPGLYCVYLKSPMQLPCGMELAASHRNWPSATDGVWSPCGLMGTGFFHDGKREENDKDSCMGPITTLLQDDCTMKYKCMKCNKIWPKPSDNN